MKDNSFWKIFDKFFGSYPFQVLISITIGGIAYVVTPNNSYLLEKFSKLEYIVFISLITYLVLSGIVWISSLIKGHFEKRKIQFEEDEKAIQFLDEQRKKLFEITDRWHQSDIDLLRKFILTNNEKYWVKGALYSSDGLLGASFVNRDEEIVPIRRKKGENFSFSDAVDSVYTVFWLKEDYYKIIKLIYEKFGKLSNYDKGEKKNK